MEMVDSALLSAFESAFVANGIQHDFTFGSQEIGNNNKQRDHDNHQERFGYRAPFVEPKRAVQQSRYEKRGNQQDDAGITETVERFKELHDQATREQIQSLYRAQLGAEQVRSKNTAKFKCSVIREHAGQMVHFCCSSTDRTARILTIPTNQRWVQTTASAT